MMYESDKIYILEHLSLLNERCAMEYMDDVLLNYETNNFIKWLRYNRNAVIGYNYKKVRTSIESKIKDNNMSLPVSELETKKEEFVEKLYLSKILTELKYKNLGYIKLPPDISNYFWLRNLVQLGHSKERKQEVFKGKKAKEKEYFGELYSQRIYKYKYSVIIDAALISAFTHDICIGDRENIDSDSVEVVVNESCRKAVEAYKIDESKINGIVNDIEAISKYYGDGVDGSILRLVRHLIPLIIFVIVNLPKNELYNEDSNNVSQKLLPIVLTACQSVIKINSIDTFLADKKIFDLNNMQRDFLLASYNSKTELKRALTNRYGKEATYPDRYNSITLDLKTGILEDNTIKEIRDIKVIRKGDYNNLGWLFTLHSHAMDLYNEKSRSISPQSSVEIFMELIDSCEIKINGNPFHFNKTFNLVVFNSLTRLIDARLQVNQEGRESISELNGILTKRAILESLEIPIDEDVKILNMIRTTIESIILDNLNPIKSNIDFDPYENYKTAIIDPLYKPSAKRNNDGSFAWINEGDPLPY